MLIYSLVIAFPVLLTENFNVDPDPCIDGWYFTSLFESKETTTTGKYGKGNLNDMGRHIINESSKLSLILKE